MNRATSSSGDISVVSPSGAHPSSARKFTSASGTYPAAVEAHFLKYRSLFASLALIFEVLRYVSHRDEGRDRGAVGAVSAMRAAVWCEHLESHAMRLYHPAIVAPVIIAGALLERIEAGDVAHGMKTRDMLEKGLAGL